MVAYIPVVWLAVSNLRSTKAPSHLVHGYLPLLGLVGTICSVLAIVQYKYFAKEHQVAAKIERTGGSPESYFRNPKTGALDKPAAVILPGLSAQDLRLLHVPIVLQTPLITGLALNNVTAFLGVCYSLSEQSYGPVIAFVILGLLSSLFIYPTETRVAAVIRGIGQDR